jgi:DNA (cytosine-5)-methyltransferase 1
VRVTSSNTAKPAASADRARRRTVPVQVVDLFSGCGGMSFGFQNAGTSHLKFQVLGGLDVDTHANATYERMIGAHALERDIRDLQTPTILKKCAERWGLDRARPLILIGCAPCQGFSSHRKKDPRKDSRNGLLHAFASVTVQLNPDLVIMENVPEMLQSKHWRHFSSWKKTLEDAGYSVRARIYNLAQFGVPQERYRALVVASRSRDTPFMPQPAIAPSDFVTVRQAIGGLPPLTAGGRDLADPMHETSKHRPDTVRLISLIPKDGGSRRSLPPGVGLSCWDGVDGFRDVYGRLWWDRPAVAITARCRTPSCGRFTHPEQDRGLSAREAALLQGFPPDFYFCGPFDDRYKQIGNAVSPIFSKAVAEHLDRHWDLESRSWRTADDKGDDVVSPIKTSFSSGLASMKRRLRHTHRSVGVPA